MTGDGRPGDVPTEKAKPQAQDLDGKPANDPDRGRAHPRVEGPLPSKTYQGSTLIGKAECLVYEGVSARHTLMVVKGELEGHPIEFLVDSGATHSFVSEDWIAAHNVPTQEPAKPLKVRMADGSPMRGWLTEHLPAALIKLSAYEATHPFLVARLPRFDGILGYDWLKGLGRFSADLGVKTIAFDFNGQRIILKGSPEELDGSTLSAS